MSSRQRFLRIATAIFLFLLACAGAAQAQFEGGDLYGTIIDESGAPLPDVKVTLTCRGSRHVGVTDEKGRVRFASLAPGNYAMRAEHVDFDPVVYDTVEILVGRPTTMHMRMAQDADRTRVVTS
jgi:protocatechuate 3,4-dioxygenase beta subunit